MSIPDFLNQLSNIPTTPGVYLMFGTSKEVLYVGKALNLRTRLRSYFVPKHENPKTRMLVGFINDFEVILTETEQEALILECNLIKEYQPRFNSRLKDDKTYPFIKIDTSEKFPQIYITRNVQRGDGAKYFGPYASATSVRKTLGLLKKLFPYRSCTKNITGTDDRACLDFHINRCIGPCIGAADEFQYQEVINQVEMFLRGQTKQILTQLNIKMLGFAEDLEFEKASMIRDQINAIGSVQEKQKVLSADKDDMDVIALEQKNQEAWVEIFFIRSGKLVGRDHYLMNVGINDEMTDVLLAFLKQFYEVSLDVPKTILIQFELGLQEDEILQFLTVKRGAKVSLITPKRGPRKQMMNMVSQNAVQGMTSLHLEKRNQIDQNIIALDEIQEALSLPRFPKRIECYDISNIQGTNPVGSMIVFENGKPKKSDYRKFQIKNVLGVDDYMMMREMLGRRLKRLKDDQSSGNWKQVPDLILIDGGKGHLAAVLQVFLEGGFYDEIPLASIAKQKEEIFIPQNPESIQLTDNSQGLYLMQRIRDEAHRFAVTYHRHRRSKNSLKSKLDAIQGIGPTKRKHLINKFGSVSNVAASDLDELIQIPGINKNLAIKILSELN